jgi:protein-L-isoaspartate(D-aspartate) O-methyltransferase
MTNEEARAWFAEEIRLVAGLDSQALVAAFGRVPRERFLGPGPWQLLGPGDPNAPYRTTADADPRHLYHDVLVAIDPARKLNNGQPSSLARWIAAADVRPGDRVLHVGCGVGYYTAMFAELAGPGGRVVGIEVDPQLAARARAALEPWPMAEVETGDASAVRGPFDAMFINAGCTHPRPEWLAALALGGRLVIPLTMHIPGKPHGVGAMLRVERVDGGRWPAAVVTAVGIYDCENARSDENEAELRKLAALGPSGQLAKGLVAVVEPHERGSGCLIHLPGFCLQRCLQP